MKPLRGMTVLDLSKVIAGPLCGQWLGDLGAEVIKVEPVERGDETRGWPPHRDGESSSFLSLNRNKRSVAVDLKTAEGRGIVHRLAAKADVVLQGFGSGTAARLGVDYPTLAALRPDLVYCEISGFGRTGPLGDRPGYDVMVQAFSGLISTMGEEGGGVVRASFSPVDQATAMHALAGVLAGLLERARTEKGCLVEASLMDSAFGLLGYMASNFWQAGVRPRRMGSAHPLLCPYQAFAAADGHLMLAVGNDAQWRRFCHVADLPLADDPRFRTNPDRVANFAATVAAVQNILSARTAADWVSVLTSAGVPVSVINSLEDALEHPQLAARDLIVEDDHPTLGPIKNIGYPVMFNGERSRSSRPPPTQGQHTAEILSEYGYNQNDIEALRKRSVIL